MFVGIPGIHSERSLKGLGEGVDSKPGARAYLLYSEQKKAAWPQATPSYYAKSLLIAI